jgi:signal transduction histidine kinase
MPTDSGVNLNSVQEPFAAPCEESLTAICEQLSGGAAVFRLGESGACCAAAHGLSEAQLEWLTEQLSSQAGTREALHRGERYGLGALTLLPLHAGGTLRGVLATATLPPPPLTRLAASALALADRERAAQEQADRLRAQLASARHDLKGPLAAVKGYLDMLLREQAGPIPPPMRRYLERCLSAVVREVALIDSLHAE